MIWKNAEFHNVAELIENEDGSVSWLRMPILRICARIAI